jgi:formamidopyrimidine-DNA glycosylase
VPELPEVETVAHALSEKILGHTIVDCVVRNPALRWPITDDFPSRLLGQKILHIHRRSKYLLWQLSEGYVIAHLGMTGSFSLRSEPKQRPHDHVQWRLSSGDYLSYHDPRRFGCLLWSATLDHPLLRSLGPEPLAADFEVHYLHTAFKGKKQAVKAALMDSHIVVGVGNIYAAEALFRAGIHPDRAAGRISKIRLENLVTAIKTVLAEAIEMGGTSFSDFVTIDGGVGQYQERKTVYGRKGLPCVQCGTAIALMTHSGRSTFYCPRCQT